MKCPVCNSRKGKRKCLLTTTWICSLCCGQERSKDSCEGCPYFRERKPQRRYGEVPAYTAETMANRSDLTAHAYVIEEAISTFDADIGGRLRDETALRMLELLMDQYHFQDLQLASEEERAQQGLQRVATAIDQHLSDLSALVLVRVLCTIYLLAKRRSQGGREYLNFLREFAPPGGPAVLP